MRSGCLNLVFRVGVVAAAAVLAALSLALLISFALSALGQPDGAVRIFTVMVAFAAGLSFFLVGRSIWRDLKERRRTAELKSRSESQPGGDDRS